MLSPGEEPVNSKSFLTILHGSSVVTQFVEVVSEVVQKKCKHWIVLVWLVTSKLLKTGANKRIATVDRNVGIVSPRCRSMDPFRLDEA